MSLQRYQAKNLRRDGQENVVSLSDALNHLRGCRVGLVSNHTSVMQDLQHLVDVLRDCEDVALKVLFAPEHGFYGEMDVELDSAIDPRTGLPIHSLYGARRKPEIEMLAGLDVLLFSIQDVGVRFYTFVSTMYHCMVAAAEQGIGFVVFDRPNPITGMRIEGNVTEAAHTSFISVTPLPIRHGMTIGELALMFNDVYEMGLDLKVIQMPSWDRHHWFDQTEWRWVMPSPAMPNLDTAIVYPGTCLFEGMNFSIGRGTSRPFELIGAPWMDAFRLADAMNEKGLLGTFFRPTFFVPTYRTHKDTRCAGVQIHVTDREVFEPVRMAMALLAEIRGQYSGVLDWGSEERVHRKMGSPLVRKQVEAGVPVEKILEGWAAERKEFEQVRKDFLIYD